MHIFRDGISFNYVYAKPLKPLLEGGGGRLGGHIEVRVSFHTLT